MCTCLFLHEETLPLEPLIPKISLRVYHSGNNYMQILGHFCQMALCDQTGIEKAIYQFQDRNSFPTGKINPTNIRMRISKCY